MQDGTNGNLVSPLSTERKKIAPQRRTLSETQPKVLPSQTGSSHRLERAKPSSLLMAKVKKTNALLLELSPIVGSTAALRPIPKSRPQSKFGRNQQLRLNPIQLHNSASNVDFGDRLRPEPIQHIALHDRNGGPSSKGSDQKLKDSTAALHPRPIQKVICRSLDRRQACKPSIRTGQPPPATDPIRTAALWQRVKLRYRPSEKKMPPKVARPTLFSALELRMPSTTSAADDASTSHGTANATDRAFRDTVLRGRGIVFTDALTLETPYAHFRTDIPNGIKTVMSWYQDRCGLPECAVWHEKDHDLAVQQATQYRMMVRLQENEVKFSYRGKQYFFKDDSLIPPEEAIRGSSTYFKLEWDPQPDGQLLQAPPMQADNVNEEVFDFYTKPDCTYWLSHRRFNAAYRNHISWLTHVLEPAGAISPYLTIEFKKGAHPTAQAAENQVAAASALILYNRTLLRCKGLAKQGKAKHSWNSNDFSDIKHYGITFAGKEATFWIILPTIETGGTEDPWRGCSIGRMFTRNAGEPDEVLGMKEWINEIHHWGLNEYGRELERDVKRILRHIPGGERVSMMPDEIAAPQR